MNCLQRLYEPNGSSCSPTQAQCLCGLRIALVIIAACGISFSIGAVVSYFRPPVGYAGCAAAVISLCGLALSYIRCSGEAHPLRQESHTNPTTDSIPVRAPIQSKLVRNTISNSRNNSVELVEKEKKIAVPNHNRCIALREHEIPNEIALHILGYLTPRELIAMGLISKTWWTISCDNILWTKHCANHCIPINNSEGIGAYAGQFVKIQRLTAAIIKKEIYPKTITFEKPIYAVLIDGDRAFLSFKDGVEIWDAKFSKTEQTLISGFSEYRIPDRISIRGNILYCLHAPTANRNYDRKGILFAYDLAHNEGIMEETSISLYEWEHGESKRRGGRLAFSENKAFCNYKNGDIRVWNLKKQYKEYTDDIEYDDYTEDRQDKDIQLLVKFQEELIRERQILRGHAGQITHLSVVDDHLYSSSEDGTIKIWHIDTAQCVKTVITDLSHSAQGSSILGVDHFLVHGDYIFGYMHDQEEGVTFCKLWDVHSGLCLQMLKFKMRIDSYCVHGNLLFFSCSTTIYAYSLNSGQEIQTFSCEIPNSDSYDVLMLVNLQVIDDKLICIGKKNNNYQKQIFIFDFPKVL